MSLSRNLLNRISEHSALGYAEYRADRPHTIVTRLEKNLFNLAKGMKDTAAEMLGTPDTELERDDPTFYWLLKNVLVHLPVHNNSLAEFIQTLRESLSQPLPPPPPVEPPEPSFRITETVNPGFNSSPKLAYQRVPLKSNYTSKFSPSPHLAHVSVPQIHHAGSNALPNFDNSRSMRSHHVQPFAFIFPEASSSSIPSGAMPFRVRFTPDNKDIHGLDANVHTDGRVEYPYKGQVDAHELECEEMEKSVLREWKCKDGQGGGNAKSNDKGKVKAKVKKVRFDDDTDTDSGSDDGFGSESSEDWEMDIDGSPRYLSKARTTYGVPALAPPRAGSGPNTKTSVPQPQQEDAHDAEVPTPPVIPFQNAPTSSQQRRARPAALILPPPRPLTPPLPGAKWQLPRQYTMDIPIDASESERSETPGPIYASEWTRTPSPVSETSEAARSPLPPTPVLSPKEITWDTVYAFDGRPMTVPVREFGPSSNATRQSLGKCAREDEAQKNDSEGTAEGASASISAEEDPAFAPMKNRLRSKSNPQTQPVAPDAEDEPEPRRSKRTKLKKDESISLQSSGRTRGSGGSPRTSPKNSSKTDGRGKGTGRGRGGGRRRGGKRR